MDGIAVENVYFFAKEELKNCCHALLAEGFRNCRVEIGDKKISIKK